MARNTIAIDISRCSGCGSCLFACKDEHVGNDYSPLQRPQPSFGHNWLDLKEIEQGSDRKIKVDYIPLFCQHCAKPSCVKHAPEGSVQKREDGLVIYDLEKTKGCKDIVKDCAYGVVFWNDELNIPQKCGFCAQELDSKSAKAPRCVESCPTAALFYGDIDDPNSEISKYIAKRGDFKAYRPETGNEPRVLFRELPAPFITGEVLLADKPNECCPGATVKISCTKEGCTGMQTTTDFLGDFQFKGLSEGERYTLIVSYPGYKDLCMEFVLDAARELGVITLSK